MSKIIEIKNTCVLVPLLKENLLFRDVIPRDNMHGGKLKGERKVVRILGPGTKKLKKYI